MALPSTTPSADIDITSGRPQYPARWHRRRAEGVVGWKMALGTPTSIGIASEPPVRWRRIPSHPDSSTDDSNCPSDGAAVDIEITSDHSEISRRTALGSPTGIGVASQSSFKSPVRWRPVDQVDPALRFRHIQIPRSTIQIGRQMASLPQRPIHSER